MVHEFITKWFLCYQSVRLIMRNLNLNDIIKYITFTIQCVEVFNNFQFCELCQKDLLFCKASDCFPYGLHMAGRIHVFIRFMFFIISENALIILSCPTVNKKLLIKISNI